MRSDLVLAAAAALFAPALAQDYFSDAGDDFVNTTLTTRASGYKLAENYFDGDFFSHFNFFTDADPTHGFVQYVSQKEAQAGGLIKSTASSAWVGADSTTVLTGNAGRKSVRLQSKKSYTHALIAITLDKLPIACGGWPAFWTVGPEWPKQGEIDIIEGVNTKGANKMTLHTSPGCSASGQANGLIKPDFASCLDNQGCGFTESNTDSYQGVNQNGGGTWAMEWTSQGINIWWWYSKNGVPADVFGNSPNPAGWGKPSMNVPNGANCNIDQHFKAHNLIFDWTFCGDWAGNDGVWAQSGCKSAQYPTCQSFVQNNPKAYAGVGFDVRALKVYTQG